MKGIEEPVRPGTKLDAKIVAALREHLNDEDAQVLAGRIETADQDALMAEEWPVVKARIPEQQKPRP